MLFRFFDQSFGPAHFGLLHPSRDALARLGADAFFAQAVIEGHRNVDVVQRRMGRIALVFGSVPQNVRVTEIVAAFESHLEPTDQERKSRSAAKSVSPPRIAGQFHRIRSLFVDPRPFRFIIVFRVHEIREVDAQVDEETSVPLHEIEMRLPHQRQFERIDRAVVARVAFALQVVHESASHVLQIGLDGPDEFLRGIEFIRNPARIEPPFGARLPGRGEPCGTAAPSAAHADIMLGPERSASQQDHE